MNFLLLFKVKMKMKFPVNFVFLEKNTDICS